MESEKASIKCIACGHKLKIKIRDRLSQLNCTKCGLGFKTCKGEIIESDSFDVQRKKSVNSEKIDLSKQKSQNEGNFSKKNSSSEYEVAQKIEKVEVTEVGEYETVSGLSKKNIFWKVLSLLLLTAASIFGFLWIRSDSERIEKQKISNQFVKLVNGNEISGVFNAKNLLNDETQKLFEVFIESQLIGNDSISKSITSNFLNSLKSHGFVEKQLFSYLTINKDTVFFLVEHEPYLDSYRLKTTLKEF